ncbi:MAG: GNAT family N-acetyltransferase [Chloroflexota bacterium]
MSLTTKEIQALIRRHPYPQSSHFQDSGEPIGARAGINATLAFYISPFGIDVHWGAASPDDLLTELRAAVLSDPQLADQPLRLEFVPGEFETPLSEAGFETTSEWCDSWLDDLDGYTAVPSGCLPVRPLGPADGPIVGRITRSCRLISRDHLGESDSFLADWLSEPPNTGFLAHIEGDPAGVALTSVYGHGSPRGPVCWLRGLAVSPSYQRRGIGRELALTVLQWGRRNGARRAFLHVDRENPAVRLYASLGFGLRPGRGQINMMTVASIVGPDIVFRPARPH